MRGNLLLILFLLSSCGSQVTVSSRGCQDIQLLSQKDLKKLPAESSQRFHFEHVIWTQGLFRPHATHSLKRVLSERNIPCEDVKSVYYSFHDKWQDIMLAFLPFTNRQSLLVEGVYR